MICSNCNLCETRKKITQGIGNPSSKIWIIGRDPGKTEDQIGLPFVGRAGQRLRTLVAKMGYDLESNFYAVNLVRCHTPLNCGPTLQQMQTCFLHLKSEIFLHQPKMLILLGKEVSKFFLNCKNIQKGVIFPQNSLLFLSTYHPSYLVRNGNKYDLQFQHHFAEALKFLP